MCTYASQRGTELQRYGERACVRRLRRTTLCPAARFVRCTYCSSILLRG